MNNLTLMITISEIIKVVILAVFFAYAYRKFKTSKRGYMIDGVQGIKLRK